LNEQRAGYRYRLLERVTGMKAGPG
jgi:hypothetical protein